MILFLEMLKKILFTIKTNILRIFFTTKNTLYFSKKIVVLQKKNRNIRLIGTKKRLILVSIKIKRLRFK
jgi:hypothetical protein